MQLTEEERTAIVKDEDVQDTWDYNTEFKLYTMQIKLLASIDARMEQTAFFLGEGYDIYNARFR
jgi:hypothetical protein